MKLIDAHCHLANLAETHVLQPLLREACENGITGFISSALKKTDLDWHRNNPEPNILLQAGVHPNFDECDLDLETVRSLAENKQITLIGEIGLDKNNPDLEGQKRLLHKQCQIASDNSLPVSLHIVGHQSEVYTLLKHYRLSCLVHGYAGSIAGFELLTCLNSIFSISSRILREDKYDLLLAMIRSKRFVFETDITQYYVKEGERNPLLRLASLVEQCSRISSFSVQDLIRCQEETLNSFLGFFPW